MLGKGDRDKKSLYPAFLATDPMLRPIFSEFQPNLEILLVSLVYPSVREMVVWEEKDICIEAGCCNMYQCALSRLSQLVS